ncbi:MAG: transposase [Richelia sp. SM2_1_7]|nr:transposase [Richelia sp. SM2_1_7]
MRQSSFTESQRLAILAEQDAGQSVEVICRKHQISPATFYKWKRILLLSKMKTNVE